MSIKQFLFVNDAGFYEEGYVEGIANTRNCDSTLAVGDLVMESATITYGVDKVTGNNDVRNVIGWVFSKPTTTTAEIILKGTITGLSGLTKSKKVYLSSNGTFTNDKPTNGYLHILGHAVNSDKLDFNPINTKIKIYHEGLTFPLTKDSITVANTTYFGRFVETDGKTLVIGDYHANSGKGQVHVYSWNNASKSWSYVTALTASDASTNDFLGTSIIVDGDTIVAGAWGKDVGGYTEAGGAYSFVYSGGSWSQDKIFESSSPSKNAYFGYHVDITSNHIYITEPYADDGGHSNNGNIHIYDRGTSNSVIISGEADNENIGLYSISAYANRVAFYFGSYNARILETSDGLNYTKMADIAPGGLVGETYLFNKDTLILGVSNLSNANNKSCGVVKIYKYNGSSWVDSGTIEPADGDDGDSFGSLIDIFGNYMAIGAPNNDDGASNSGSVYIYEYDGSNWNLKQKYAHDVTDHHIPHDDLCIDDHGVYIGHSNYNSNQGEVIYLKKS